MNKKETVARLCSLVTLVGSRKFNSRKEHDCFCEKEVTAVSPEILEFIETAVRESLERESLSEGEGIEACEASPQFQDTLNESDPDPESEFAAAIKAEEDANKKNRASLAAESRGQQQRIRSALNLAINAEPQEVRRAIRAEWGVNDIGTSKILDKIEDKFRNEKSYISMRTRCEERSFLASERRKRALKRLSAGKAEDIENKMGYGGVTPTRGQVETTADTLYKMLGLCTP